MSDLEKAESAQPLTSAELAAAFAPLVQSLRQFEVSIGALGRAYCAVLDEWRRQTTEETWSWPRTRHAGGPSR